MADEYTPTTEDVRNAYTYFGRDVEHWESPGARARAEAEFDRWLSAHDREVAASALEDAAESIRKAVEFGHIVASSTGRTLDARAAAIREGQDGR